MAHSKSGLEQTELFATSGVLWGYSEHVKSDSLGKRSDDLKSELPNHDYSKIPAFSNCYDITFLNFKSRRRVN